MWNHTAMNMHPKREAEQRRERLKFFTPRASPTGARICAAMAQ